MINRGVCAGRLYEPARGKGEVLTVISLPVVSCRFACDSSRGHLCFVIMCLDFTFGFTFKSCITQKLSINGEGCDLHLDPH